ncbi:MAG: signal peptide peptidase SppA [Sedimentisphaerales bacterium]|nr:signal peptide peptidase SppA [Sedimentisphaerales bacterium]
MFRRNSWSFLGILILPTVLVGCGQTAFHVELVPTDRQLEETRIQSDAGLFVFDKITIIDVDGQLFNRQKGGWLRRGENPVSLFIEKLDKVAADRSVKAVILRLNSPGGTVAASDIMYHHLQKFRQQTGKPVIACVLGIGCSGAYYIACGCDGIIAQPSSVVGNIGTIFQTFSVAGTMEKIGVKAVTIKSGELKDMASPLHDLNEEERKVLEGIIEHHSEQFFEVVRNGRKKIDERKMTELSDGRVFTAEQALEQGLIDKIGYLDDGINWAKEMAGVKKSRVVIYSRPSSYMPNAYGVASANADGIGPLVNLELPEWLNSDGAQFLYLWLPAVK